MAHTITHPWWRSLVRLIGNDMFGLEVASSKALRYRSKRALKEHSFVSRRLRQRCSNVQRILSMKSHPSVATGRRPMPDQRAQRVPSTHQAASALQASPAHIAGTSCIKT